MHRLIRCTSRSAAILLPTQRENSNTRHVRRLHRRNALLEPILNIWRRRNRRESAALREVRLYDLNQKGARTVILERFDPVRQACCPVPPESAHHPLHRRTVHAHRGKSETRCPGSPSWSGARYSLPPSCACVHPLSVSTRSHPRARRAINALDGIVVEPVPPEDGKFVRPLALHLELRWSAPPYRIGSSERRSDARGVYRS